MMASSTPVESTTTVADPVIPYMELIPGGLYPGRNIVIKGVVLRDSRQKRFVVDFCCGLLIQGDHQNDKALHFNLQFDTNSLWFYPSADRHIVLNSLIGNRWGMEERYANIAVDGRRLCDYLHQIPIINIRAIYIAGNVRISMIEYQGIDNTKTPEQMEITDKVGKLSITDFIRKPKVPFGMRLKERLSHGTKILITGIPLMNAEHFTINFLTPAEYFFHFRVDFSVGNEKEAIVRNSTRYGEWQKEEREMCSFSFRRGITFDIMFCFKEECIT